jgi:hypothetical protein
MFESESPLTEIDLTSNSGFDHPLQRSINRRPTNLVIVTMQDGNEVISA